MSFYVFLLKLNKYPQQKHFNVNNNKRNRCAHVLLFSLFINTKRDFELLCLQFIATEKTAL